MRRPRPRLVPVPDGRNVLPLDKDKGLTFGTIAACNEITKAAVRQVSVAICQHWPKVPDGCAAICMDRLGCIPAEGCRHAEEVHGARARSIIKQLI